MEIFFESIFINIKKIFNFGEVLEIDEEELVARIKGYCPTRSISGQEKKQESLIDSTSQDLFQKVRYQSHLINLNMYIDILFHYQGHLLELESQMIALASEIEEYKIIQTIPGIGEKIAAKIISEIGEIDLPPKKLVASTRIDPIVHSS